MHHLAIKGVLGEREIGFLKEKFGKMVTALELEKNYFIHKQKYYDNIRALGLEYEELDYSKSMDFLLMTVNSLKN